MSNKDPILFCNTYPSAKFEGKIHFPFGIGKLDLPDPVCENLVVTMGSIGAAFSVFLPFIKIVECVSKVFEILVKLKDIITGLPIPDIEDVEELFEKIEGLSGCASLFLSFTPVGNITSFCAFLRDIVRLCIALIDCLKGLVSLREDLDNEIASMEGSLDADIQHQVECLRTHSRGIDAEISAKLSSMTLLFTLMNTLFKLIPLGEVSGIELPTKDEITVSLTAFEDLEEVLRSAEGVLDACSGGL